MPAKQIQNKKIIINDINSYFQNKYIDDVKDCGIDVVWDKIIQKIAKLPDGQKLISEIGGLYEAGLAENDKISKKACGKYYTPEDTAMVMAEWLEKLEGENICDAACGTGQLILTYLKLIGKEAARKILSQKRLYLYDIDKTALNICKATILHLYGKEFDNSIHTICGDFLDKNISLPENCKVIANPPYAGISDIPVSWQQTEIQNETKELYSCFMEKILKQSKSSVIISPYSFLGSGKFYPLRKLMNNYGGFVVSFDNVPGTIFCGKKHGIFNSNTSNSVRAAITVVDGKEKHKGFRISPLIRFKTVERKDLLNNKVLEDFLPSDRQIINSKNRMYYKCHKNLTGVLAAWQKSSDKTLGGYTTEYGEFEISIPNTCRYYTTASNKKLNRSGQITLKFDDKDVFNYIFCMVNSSFAYWHWRLYDGGITYPKGLLLSMPVFFNKLSKEDKIFFEDTANEMISKADEFAITKNNVGIQENIKYPKRFRDKINTCLLEILKISAKSSDFDVIHSNSAIRVNGRKYKRLIAA